MCLCVNFAVAMQTS